MGSWLTYALGSENQNLPGYIVLCPGKPVVGPYLWSNSFLPGVYQGTHINNKNIDPAEIIRDVKNRYLTAAEQREQLDLVQRSIACTSRRGRPTISSKRASPRSKWPTACRARRQKRSTSAANRSSRARPMATANSPMPACMARRLAERGVRVVQIYYGNDQPWDDHKDITNHRDHAQKSDRADRRPA